MEALQTKMTPGGDPMTDAELLSFLRSCPEEGLRMIMRQYTGLVYTIIYGHISSVGSAADTEELTSDVFVDLWRTRDSVDLNRGSLKTYLAMLAKRRAISFYRTAAAKPEILPVAAVSAFESAAGDGQPGSSAILCSDEDIPGTVADAEFRKNLIDAVLALGEPDTGIILRRYFYHESITGIAEHTGLGAGAIKMRIHRALKKLRKQLGEI
jgi:RNA polymerase sigma-70 factor (ECF subfamily)